MVVDDDFTRAAIFAVAALAIDVLHYVYIATAYSLVYRGIEKGTFNIDREGGPFPNWLDGIAWMLFGLKVAAIAVAYCLLGVALWSRLS